MKDMTNNKPLLYSVFIVIILIIIGFVYYNFFVFRIRSIYPDNNIIPTSVHQIRIDFSKELAERSSQPKYFLRQEGLEGKITSSFNNKRLVINFTSPLVEGEEVSLKLNLVSKNGDSFSKEIQLKAQYVPFNSLPLEEQELQTNQSDSFEDNNPTNLDLPYFDSDGPFTVDYSSGADLRYDKPFIKITDSTPSGRVSALKWIREQGYDPSDLDIRYIDFVNPLEESAEAR